jgi:hypothetical protein|tara:strand:- start:93 stop:362 length:270 start_codon:yes stop_codon:yes gene_type:complete
MLSEQVKVVQDAFMGQSFFYGWISEKLFPVSSLNPPFDAPKQDQRPDDKKSVCEYYFNNSVHNQISFEIFGKYSRNSFMGIPMVIRTTI